MIWVAWRQQRATLVAVGLLTLALGAYAVFLRVQLSSPAAQECGNTRGSCGPFEMLTLQSFLLTSLGPGLLVLLAALLGSSLVTHDLARRTHLLAWTQSISRSHWLAVKLALGLVAVVTMALALGPAIVGLATLLASDPTAPVSGGTVPAGALDPDLAALSSELLTPGTLALLTMSLVGFAAAVTAGVMFRRVLVALMIGLFAAAVTFFALGSVVTTVIPPLERESEAAIDSYGPYMSGTDFVLTAGYQNRNGQRITDENAYEVLYDENVCPALGTLPGLAEESSDQDFEAYAAEENRVLRTCAKEQGVTGLELYYPPGRQTALKVAQVVTGALAALLLLGLAWYWVMRRTR